MALARLTQFQFLDRELLLSYSDGRQWYVPYLGIIATLIDPTSGEYVAKIFEKGLVGETLEATQADLNTLGSNVSAFVAELNGEVGSLSFWNEYYSDYVDRGIADGGTTDSRLARRCAKDKFFAIVPFADNSYILTFNTQMRSLADSGNGFDARTLDCAAGRITPIIN
jgi:hypothetical protein